MIVFLSSNNNVISKVTRTSVRSVTAAATFLTFDRHGTTRTYYHHSLSSSSKFLDQVEETIHNVFNKHDIIPSSITQQRINNNNNNNMDINSIIESIQPITEREAVGIAIHLNNRIYSLMKNNDCRRCWLQKAHCICDLTPSLENHNNNNYSNNNNNKSNNINNNSNNNTQRKDEDDDIIILPSSINRIFLLMHHKEIGMAVDTAKLLLGSFDISCRLVVGGLDEQYQESMIEFNNVLKQKERKCMVLFPSDDAMTFHDLHHNTMIGRHYQQHKDHHHIVAKDNTNNNTNKNNYTKNVNNYVDDKWDVIVIDGTWSQARKMYSRYIPKENGPYRVCLSQEAVNILNNSNRDEQSEDSNLNKRNNHSNRSNGRQLRRHPIKWREISTLEATRLLIRDIMLEEQSYDTATSHLPSNKLYCFDILSEYQFISDTAAKKQLGTPRLKQS